MSSMYVYKYSKISTLRRLPERLQINIQCKVRWGYNGTKTYIKLRKVKQNPHNHLKKKKRHSWISNSKSTSTSIFFLPCQKPLWILQTQYILKQYHNDSELEKWQNKLPGLHPSYLNSSAFSNPSTWFHGPLLWGSSDILNFSSKHLLNANYV